MPNTEKPIAMQEKKRQGIVETKENKEKIIPEIKKEETLKEKDKKEEISKEKEEKKTEKIKIKKELVEVNARNIPISTKEAMAVCKFIKGKKIQTAIDNLHEVIKLKKAVPMKGEIPHRKGKMMSGRYPVKASTHFVKILKSLLGNSNNHNLEEPIIKDAIANSGQRPYGKKGSVRKKRTNIRITAIEKKKIQEKKK